MESNVSYGKICTQVQLYMASGEAISVYEVETDESKGSWEKENKLESSYVKENQ